MRICSGIVVALLDIFLGYQTVGNFLRGYNGPILYGKSNAYFFGYYMIAITYGVFFIVGIVVLILLIFLKRKQIK